MLVVFVTFVIILVLVILSLTLVMVLLVQEGIGVYERIQLGEFDFGRYFQQVFNALSAWIISLLDRFELTNLRLVQERLLVALRKSSQFLAGQALNLGQNTLNFVLSSFVMLYLLFFLLRDGDALVECIRGVIPLVPEQLCMLVSCFTGVIRVTVKGIFVVVVVQGALGGLIFWLLGIHVLALWAVLMVLLFLLFVVGIGLVWLSVAIYFLAIGAIWQGIVLIVYGVLVIGLVDNVLCLILVGKDTRMFDYVVLISTLGGIAIFGINGFVIGLVIAAMFIAVWGMLSASGPGFKPVRPDIGVREEQSNNAGFTAAMSFPTSLHAVESMGR